MTDADRLVTGAKRDADDAEQSLRPQYLREFIGQEQARSNLKVFIEAAKSRGDALSKRFEEALKQARQEPVSRPARDFDLD